MPALQAVLFDLDGTLLDNDMDVFLPRYFQAVGGAVSHILPPKEFLAHLMTATRQMVANDGRDTNEEVFAAAFYPLLGRPRAEMEPIFEDFYARDFPALQAYTRCRPEARGVVQTAFDAGYKVAIATNPLFPASAIYQRLAWAGVDGFPYALVTTYENSRACKPNPIYFRQIAETLGCPPEACLMVGNEADDLQSAHIGCRTYLVEDGTPGNFATEVPLPAYRGRLADLPQLLLAERSVA
jgi:FMN phosphatase YigB (HAD superfamily)